MNHGNEFKYLLSDILIVINILDHRLTTVLIFFSFIKFPKIGIKISLFELIMLFLKKRIILIFHRHFLQEVFNQYNN